ncbi:hypothetical protein FEM48_Zijuj02G0208700 [Ziziphus jujuba var. spinosa]|uniref:Peptidase C1A papain C-terminal domain-containing protein n=1 Tax=Ziziphus jujuba var. spinosa TaxID=714518 RepID=A0A978VXW3_ZIZJJ|nr:hypothetical protein FEM48_Zijuj02G0208700 [Ziziphus jujuba var. spinosa]
MSKMEDLPKELVIPTPLHLPVEDLVRCKSVCKALYSIITSRPFIDVGQKIRNSYTLVKYEEDPFNRHHAISLLSDETLEIIDTQPVLSHTPLLDSMLTRYRDYVTVMGCCNGVVCLRCIPPHDDYGGEMFSGLVWNEKYGEHVISFDISDENIVSLEPVVKYDNGGTNESGHVMVIVGQGQNEYYEKYWHVKNTWGEGWGDEGYARLAKSVSDPNRAYYPIYYPLIHED